MCEGVRGRERECVCGARVCGRGRERECVCVCVREGERGSVCDCVCIATSNPGY